MSKTRKETFYELLKRRERELKEAGSKESSNNANELEASSEEIRRVMDRLEENMLKEKIEESDLNGAVTRDELLDIIRRKKNGGK